MVALIVALVAISDSQMFSATRVKVRVGEGDGEGKARVRARAGVRVSLSSVQCAQDSLQQKRNSKKKIVGLYFLFRQEGGRGGQVTSLKKICRPRAILTIADPPWAIWPTLLESAIQ
jgi:hypothetical protein